MKDMIEHSARQPEEKARFRHLLQILIWAKNTTGKSSSEITRLILRRGKDGLDQHWGSRAQPQ